MTQATDIVIPLATLVSRFEKHRDQLRYDLQNRPNLSAAEQAMLSGAIAAYCTEIDAVLALGGASQQVWKRVA